MLKQHSNWTGPPIAGRNKNGIHRRQRGRKKQRGERTTPPTPRVLTYYTTNPRKCIIENSKLKKNFCNHKKLSFISLIIHIYYHYLLSLLTCVLKLTNNLSVNLLKNFLFRGKCGTRITLHHLSVQ